MSDDDIVLEEGMVQETNEKKPGFFSRAREKISKYNEGRADRQQKELSSLQEETKYYHVKAKHAQAKRQYELASQPVQKRNSFDPIGYSAMAFGATPGMSMTKSGRTTGYDPIFGMGATKKTTTRKKKKKTNKGRSITIKI